MFLINKKTLKGLITFSNFKKSNKMIIQVDIKHNYKDRFQFLVKVCYVKKKMQKEKKCKINLWENPFKSVKIICQLKSSKIINKLDLAIFLQYQPMKILIIKNVIRSKYQLLFLGQTASFYH